MIPPEERQSVAYTKPAVSAYQSLPAHLWTICSRRRRHAGCYRISGAVSEWSAPARPGRKSRFGLSAANVVTPARGPGAVRVPSLPGASRA